MSTIHSLEIGNVILPNNIIAAPVAGYTDVGFRALCARFGAGLTVTELVSAKGLCYNNPGTAELIATTDDEKIKCVQIFGSEPDFMRRATEDARLAKFDIIDINMGCPVRKVVSNGDGSALMEKPDLIEKIVRATVEGANGRAVTVKMRAGVKMGEQRAVECALAAESGGASAVSVHARYREQFYSGEADHTITKAVKQALKIPVIANGDIVDLNSLERVASESGSDGFMIGRAMLGKPWIFAKLDDKHLEIDIKSVVCEHIRILSEFLPETVVCNLMKAQLCYYSKNTNRAKAVRIAVSEIKKMSDVYAAAEEYFNIKTMI